MNDLTGKVAVVLGASAEGGTGWGIAEGLAARGAKLVVGARSIEPLQRLADKVGGLAVGCDGGDHDQIAALRDAAVAAYGRIDIAVNSAATPTLSLIADATPEIMAQAVQVNLFGMVYFVKLMAEGMNDGGSIILISSMSATHPVFPHFAYAAAKAGTESLIKYAAVEYGGRGIRVNGIRIATVMSEMAGAFYRMPGVSERFIQEIPLGRMGQPDDMADACAWLAGPAYITGSMLDISGGNQINRFPFLHELPGGDANYEGSGALADRAEGKGYVPSTKR
ncbi:MAG: NAD(P)-dependent oxidoreductase [Sphingomonadales bacterium]|jgi:NAD(P)-dependent dehydrogenase (short-subunit alcohol dehydrogenase family)|nr:NAD(P)-dependent oxidoreductase [Sphingomonadales bacterium]